MSLSTPTYSILNSLNLGRTLALLVVFLLAVFFGLLATTANPIYIALGTGLILGAMLMTKPAWTIWLILVLGLLVVGVVPIWADDQSSKAAWGVSLLGFMLALMAIFKAISVPGAVRGTPAFVWVMLVFILYTILNSIAHGAPVYEFFSGFKRYFQVAGLMFALAWFRFNEKQVHHWQVFFIVVALVQLPWALYELIKLVPIRESIVHAYPGMVPIDVVAGTFGASLHSGGASGLMAFFLIIMLAFFVARRREKLLGFGEFLFLLSFILAPLFLGETKVVVILLPLMFLTLYRNELIMRPHIAAAILVPVVALTMGIGYVYLSFSPESIEDQLVKTLGYNIYETGYGNYALNRTTALTFWVERQGLHDPVSFIFGNGLGAAHDATYGHVSMRYPGYGIGLTATSTLLWEQGVLGTVLFLSTLVFVWLTASQLRHATVPSWIRADAAAIQVATVLFAVQLFYGLALLEGLPFQILFFTLLGYTALLHRYHISSTATTRKNSINLEHSGIDQDWKRRSIC